MSPSFPYTSELLAGAALKLPAPFQAPCVVESMPLNVTAFVAGGQFGFDDELPDEVLVLEELDELDELDDELLDELEPELFVLLPLLPDTIPETIVAPL